MFNKKYGRQESFTSSHFENGFGIDYYTRTEQEGSPIPPPGEDAILQDNGDFLLTDSGATLLQG